MQPQTDKKTSLCSTNHLKIVFLLLLLPILQACGSKPVFTSSPNTNAIIGQDYSYAIKTEGSQPIELFTQQAPAGFVIDAQQQASWTPAAIGNEPVVIVAKNMAGEARQNFSISVQEKPIPEAFMIGNELGKKIWGKGYLYILVKDLNQKLAAYTHDQDFRQGLLEGYLEAMPAHKSNLRPYANESIDTIVNAGALRSVYATGFQVGNKLRNNEILVEQAASAKRQSLIGGAAKALAWKSGFIVGYAGNRIADIPDNFSSQFIYPLRIYFGLPE